MNFDAERRVATGAAWLDKHRPGWERKVDLAKLHMSDTEWCICGQADAWFLNGMIADDMTLRGFLSISTRPGQVTAEYAALDAAWRSLIKTRFDTGALSDG